MRIIKNILLVLSTGYIFVYFSEHLFWARIRPDDTLGGWVGAWLAYSLLAFAFLSTVTYFRVKNIWSLFLAGAGFGWLAEGVVVQTTYEMLPLSISWTGLAWHALISVWVGWYALQKAMLSSGRFATLKLAAGIGVCAGLWAIAWWLEADGGVSSLGEYAAFSLVTTGLVIAAYALAAWSASEPFAPSRPVLLVIGGMFAVFFVFVAVPAAPLAAGILPILLGLVVLGLRRNRENESGGSLLEAFAGRISVWKLVSLLALPTASIGVYALALELGLRWNANWIVYLITTPAGFILLGVSLYRMWRRAAAVEE